MEWWDRVMSPVRRVWVGMAYRLRMRKSGVGKLRQEVRTCEYEDVQVMWEILRKTDAQIGRYPSVMKRGSGQQQRKRRAARNAAWSSAFEWAPLNFCRSF